MESKALALGKQVKAEALNSNIHQDELKSVAQRLFAILKIFKCDDNV